jgi:diguanylate cyclase (GGDEF)-like protein
MNLIACAAAWLALGVVGIALWAVDRARARRLRRREQLLQTRECKMREVAHDLIGASRDAPAAVCRVLDQALRELSPAIDGVLVCKREEQTLCCVYASGARCEYFRDARLSLERDDSPLTQAALQCLRVASHGPRQALIPGDRAFLAVPLHEGAQAVGVLYVSSSTADTLEVEESIVTLATLAVSAYQLACDRELDRERATIDALTNLLTPGAFHARLLEAIARPSTRRAALLFIDADNFKPCNDTLGHDTGDAILRTLARILAANAGSQALVGRKGGDEFCVLLSESSKIEATARAESIRKAVETYDFDALLDGKKLPCPLTASIGVSVFPIDAKTADALIETADAAMYHGKKRGRNRVCFYDVAGNLVDIDRAQSVFL